MVFQRVIPILAISLYTTDEWMRPTAEILATKIKQWATVNGNLTLNPDNLNFTGHSMGTMVSSELARQLTINGNKPSTMILLDPPDYPQGHFDVYDDDGNSTDSLYSDKEGHQKYTNFADFTRAFVGGTKKGGRGLCGNYGFATRAHESVIIMYDNIEIDIVKDGVFCPIHGYVKNAFETVVTSGKFDNMFSLKDRNSGRWQQSKPYEISQNNNAVIWATDSTNMQTYTVFENNQYRQYGGKNSANIFNTAHLFNINGTARNLFHIQNFNRDDDRISLFYPVNNGKLRYKYEVKNQTITRKTCFGIECNVTYEILKVNGERKEGVRQDVLDEDIRFPNKAKVFAIRH